MVLPSASRRWRRQAPIRLRSVIAIFELLIRVWESLTGRKINRKERPTDP